MNANQLLMRPDYGLIRYNYEQTLWVLVGDCGGLMAATNSWASDPQDLRVMSPPLACGQL